MIVKKLYAITLNGAYMSSEDYHWTNKHINLFDTKEKAERYITTYFSKNKSDYKIKSVKIF